MDENFDYTYSLDKKGVYIDEYEWPDVVAYWKQFVERMREYFKQMTWWEGENMDIRVNRSSIDLP